MPSCDFCNQADCGEGGPPGSPAYVKQQHCAQRCAGGGTDGEKNNNLTACRADSAGRAQTQFPDPTGAKPGVSGYLWLINLSSLGETWGAGFSIVDRVEVPTELESGDYLLSWRCAFAPLPLVVQASSFLGVVLTGLPLRAGGTRRAPIRSGRTAQTSCSCSCSKGTM